MARPFARCGGLRSGPLSQPIDPETFGTKAPEHLGTANIQPFRQFPPRLPFSFLPLGFLQKCAPVATLATLMRTFVRFQRQAELMCWSWAFPLLTKVDLACGGLLGW